MTPDERNVLQQFLSDLDQSRGAAKDPEADSMITGALRSNVDAGYLLVQHAILADQALQAAQQRIEALEQQQAPSQGGAPVSFLGGGQALSSQAPSSQASPPQVSQGGYWNGQPAPPPQSPLSPNSGMGSFLRSAGTLAAGMAGGEFLAQGLSNLFSPRGW